MPSNWPELSLALALALVAAYVVTSFAGFTEWLPVGGMRVLLIAATAYIIIRVGTTATRQLEREMSTGTGLDVIERTKRAHTLGRLLQNSLVVVVIDHLASELECSLVNAV